MGWPELIFDFAVVFRPLIGITNKQSNWGSGRDSFKDA